MTNLVEQPKIPGGPKPVAYRAGTRRAANRLKQLNFDPIEELVGVFRNIEKEIKCQEEIRDGNLIRLTSTGKPRAYSVEFHMSLYDRLAVISDKLLRYGYGRVPETAIVENERPMPLIVNLTKKGEVYVANDYKEDNYENFDED